MRKILTLVGGLILATGSIFAFTAPAQAYGKCPQGSDGWAFCLYYNSNQQGAYYRWTSGGGVSDLAGLVFPNDGNGSGAGQAVKNNAASASYGSASCSGCTNDYVRVFYNSGYLGNYDTVYVGTNKQLVKTYNENASWRSYFL
ncbi:hypothetical protein [Streptomyces sp. 8L]|uniref:hypothetical protein n=1 Tax=Streptomyces sp. 8L TaxID=2877242 RepID=UPI001CD27AC6|nr:hypothetical protein [Streptomyces sp. 8L]MCA1224142.1 hypothetical protein [Streptomyces sp. 8L]